MTAVKNFVAIALNVLLLIPYLSNAQTAGFTMNQTGGCSPLTINFSNTSTGFSSGSSYQWDFGNGNTSVLQNPGAVFTEEKTYTVTLTVKDGSKTFSASRTVTVYKKPVADFSPASPGVCLPYAATFNSTSSSPDGAINNYYWDFGDGITVQATSPQVIHAYNTENRYTVSLTVTSSNGCYNVVRKENVIRVLSPMTANFSAAKTALCSLTEPLVLTNSSTGPGTLSYAWDFGDNTSSAQKDPSHLYTKKNNYAVTLKLSNEHGCTAEKKLEVNAANFTTDFDIPALSCENQNTVFTDKSMPMQSSKTWKIDGNMSYGYGNAFNAYINTTGNHTIKLLNDFNGCADSATKQVIVRPTPVLNDFTYDVKGVCGVPVTVDFKDNTATAVKWDWANTEGYYNYNPVSFSSQQNSSFAFTNPYNTVTLKVTNSQGCSSQVSKYLDLSNPVGGYIYPESMGSEGNFGCVGTKFKFTPRTNNGDDFASYKWTFDDGATSTDPRPEHAFATPGNHIATLEFTTTRGCTGKYSTSVTAYAKPKANFTVSSTDVCGNTPVTFTSTSTDSYWYRWDLGTADYVYMSGDYYYYNRYLTIQYKKADAYPIRLIASNDGCSDTLTRTAYVNVKNSFPKINTPQNSCDGNRDEVTFSENSVGAQTWQWDFGDGAQSAVLNSAQTIKHTYAKTGAYKVVLITTNGACTNRDSLTAYVLKKQQPVLAGNKTDVCINDNIAYTMTMQDKNPYVDYWYNSYYYIVKWENEDGTEWNGFSASNTYWNSNVNTGVIGAYAPQSKKVRAIIQAYPFNCTDTTNYIQINVKGSFAGFDVTTENICYKSPIVLRDTSKTSAGNSISSLTWNFGDGTSQTGIPGSSISHTYAAPGYYTVNLTIRDNSGCTSTSGYVRGVQVNGPKAAFTGPASAYTNTEVAFSNTTNTYNSYNNTVYSWDFGDGSAVSANSVHTYTSKGTYSIKLTATNTATNCSDEFNTSITIVDPPKPPTPPVPPPFTVNRSYLGAGTCLPLLVNVTTTRTGSRIVWDFGDGTLVENQSVSSHVYTSARIYTIKLSVYQSNGDRYEEVNTVPVQMPQVSVNANVLSGCPGLPVELSSSAQAASPYLWDFGDGNLTTVPRSGQSHTYQTPGNYVPLTVMKDANGCLFNARLDDKIVIFEPPLVDAGPDVFISPGDAVTLRPSGSIDVIDWKWSPASYLSCNDCQYPVATPEKRLTYFVTVRNGNGCTAIDSVKIKYICGDRVMIPNIFTPNGDGKNDVFSLRAASVKQVRSMRIFNRWGQMVHQRLNYDPADHSRDWNGNSNGIQASSGTYAYIVEFECDAGEIFTKRGSFILVR